MNRSDKKLTDDPGANPDSSGVMPPVRISGLAIVPYAFIGQTRTSYQVSWTTSQPASSRVLYGAAPNLDQDTGETDVSPLVTNHVVRLPGSFLNGGTTVNVQVCSRLSGGKDGMNNAVMDGYVFSQRGSFGP